MREKLRQIERVRNVRAIRERLSEASLAVAMAKLRDAEERLEEARQAEIAGAREAIAAMREGEQREWAMSMALRKAFVMDCERMEEVRGRCEEDRVASQASLRGCRIETEQAAALHRDVRAALLMEEERRAEAEGVDRFLARGRRSSARASVNSLIEAV